MFSFLTETFIKMTGETETIEKVQKIETEEETKKDKTKRGKTNLFRQNTEKQKRDCNTIKEVVMWTHMRN